jgi:small subunit ribosomal protein S18
MRKRNLKKRRTKRAAQRRLARRVVLPKANRTVFGSKFTLDYKNLALLRRFISFEGKLLPRRASRLTAKGQRRLAKAVKTARLAALLPYVRQ